MYKYFIGLVALAIIAAGLYFYPQRTDAPETTTKTPDSQITKEPSYQWVFTDESTDDIMPQTRVSLAIDTQEYVIGIYTGTCSEIDSDLLPNEKSKVVCWYAGGGNEIGIFDEDGTTVVKVGDLDEGSAEIAGFRGNFKTVLEL